MRVRRFLYLVLLLLLGALGWQVVATWTTAPPEVNPSPPLAGQASGREEALGSFPSLDEGQRLAAVIADKDLFDPTRQRPEEEGVVQTSIPPPDHLKLVGVLQLSGQEQAFFTDAQQGGKVVRVRVGEEIGQYRLTQAERDSVTLAFAEGEELSLSLAVQRGEEAAKAPRMSLPQPQAMQRKDQSPSQSSPTMVRPSSAVQRVVAQEEQVLRQQIQQLHQRLREVRRQRVQEEKE